jgi:hypothetical protein
MLQPIWLIPQSCTQKTVDLKETLWISLRDNAWIYVATVPERLTVLCKGQKPTDIEIKCNDVLTFLSACTGTVIIRSVTVPSVNNTDKDINQPLNLTYECCEMTVDALPLGEIQLETPIESIPTHDWDLHLANHKVENVQKLFDEQELKVAHTAEKNMPLLSMIAIMIFVVFLAFCVVAAFAFAVGTVGYGLWGGGILTIIHVEQLF